MAVSQEVLYECLVPRHENRFCWTLSWGTSPHANTCTSWLTVQDAYIIYRVQRVHAERRTYKRACYRSYIKNLQFATWRYMGKTTLLLMLRTPPRLASFSGSFPTHVFREQFYCNFSVFHCLCYSVTSLANLLFLVKGTIEGKTSPIFYCTSSHIRHAGKRSSGKN